MKENAVEILLRSLSFYILEFLLFVGGRFDL